MNYATNPGNVWTSGACKSSPWEGKLIFDPGSILTPHQRKRLRTTTSDDIGTAVNRRTEGVKNDQSGLPVWGH